ncbi:MAG: hypothetical protein JXJ04_08455 [Spirochaetales bacterium]|nr:hypothetical protein [Spirochaetales bacterium]
MVRKGEIFRILQDVYRVRCSNNKMSDVQKRIIRVQISLKTGLNLRDFTPESLDTPEDIQKVLNVVRGPEIGLRDYSYREGGVN